MWQTMKCCRQRREACKLVRWASRRRCLARDKDMSKIVTGLQSNPVTAHEINNNYEEIRAKEKEYRKKHREEINAKQREYRKAHRDEINAKQREYYKARQARKKQEEEKKE